MKRDTLKTLAGLAIIAIIVVATFVYGSAQRQAQLKRDQDAKKQQEVAAGGQVNKAQPSVSAAPTSPTSSPTSSTLSPTSAPIAGAPGVTNTAPVQSPAANALQGSAAAAKDKQVAGTQTAAPVSTPVTGGSGAALPQAGSPAMGFVGLAAMAMAGLMVRRSRQAVFLAARNRR